MLFLSKGLIEKVVVEVGFLLIWILSKTVSFSLKLPDPTKDWTKNRKGIIAIWHEDVLIAAIFFSRYWTFKGIKIYVLVSRSRDGEIASKIVERLNAVAVRGSSSKGGSSALMHLRRIIEREEWVMVVMDGPKGPAKECKPGIAYLSIKQNVPIYKFTFEGKVVRLKTWDRMKVPIPFFKLEVKTEIVDNSINKGIEETIQILEGKGRLKSVG